MSNWKERADQERARIINEAQAAEQARQQAIAAEAERVRLEKLKLTDDGVREVNKLFKKLEVGRKLTELNRDLWRNAGIVNGTGDTLRDLETVVYGIGNPIEAFASLVGVYPEYQLETEDIWNKVNGPYEISRSSYGSGSDSSWTESRNGWHDEIVGKRVMSVLQKDKGFGVRIAVEFYRGDVNAVPPTGFNPSRETTKATRQVGIIAAFSEFPGRPSLGLPNEFREMDNIGHWNNTRLERRREYYGEPFERSFNIFGRKMPLDGDTFGKMEEFLDKSLLAFAMHAPDLEQTRREAEIQRKALASRVGNV